MDLAAATLQADRSRVGDEKSQKSPAVPSPGVEEELQDLYDRAKEQVQPTEEPAT